MSTDADTLPPLPPRPPSGHKGTFGTVAVVGGCAAGATRMIGAPALAAVAALRVGAGRARLVMPAPILAEAIVIAPSAIGMAIPVGPDGAIHAHEAAAAIDAAAIGCACLVIGPGMGLSAGATSAALRAVQRDDLFTVVDADALTALAGVPELLRDFRAPAVITPHAGEFRRLAGALSVPEDPTDPRQRTAGAEHMARRLGCVVVLKGPGTVVSDGQRTWINTTGNTALATAGTGDVLAGIIAGLVAQFVAPPADPRPYPMPQAARPPAQPLDLFDAARLGVAIHGEAADLWARTQRASAGMLAEELLPLLPGLVEARRQTR